MRIPEPRAVLALTILREAGEHAYLVGGCLRDLLMGRRPKDYDIASSSSPDRTCEIFKGYKTVPSGIGYGTVTVIIDGLPLEITTFRSECGYSDGRHPDAVRFVGNVEDDLSRRDFTVNAMAYNEQEGLLDPFGGLADLKAGIIRAVGQAGERFSEDALRILRALRFCAQLGFWADPQTEGAMLDCRGGLGGVSCERIGNEVLKIVAGRYFKQAFMKYRAVFADIVPEFCEYTEKWAERVQRAADDVRLYVFFHPFENRREIIERLRLPGRILKTSSLLSSMAETPSGTLPGEMPEGIISAGNLPFGTAPSGLALSDTATSEIVPGIQQLDGGGARQTLPDNQSVGLQTGQDRHNHNADHPADGLDGTGQTKIKSEASSSADLAFGTISAASKKGGTAKADDNGRHCQPCEDLERRCFFADTATVSGANGGGPSADFTAESQNDPYCMCDDSFCPGRDGTRALQPDGNNTAGSCSSGGGQSDKTSPVEGRDTGGHAGPPCEDMNHYEETNEYQTGNLLAGGSSSAEAEPRGSLENTAGPCHAPAQEGHSQASAQSDPCNSPAQDGHSQNLSPDGSCHSQNALTSPQNETRYSPTQKGHSQASIQSDPCNSPAQDSQTLVCDDSCNAPAQDEFRHTPAQEGRIQTSARDGESMELSVFIKRILRDLSDGEFELLLDFWEALGYEVSAARREFARIMAAGECCRLSALAVKGGDIAGLGYGGPKIGMVLNRCLDAVVEGRLDNRRQDILDYIKKNNMLFPGEK